MSSDVVKLAFHIANSSQLGGNCVFSFSRFFFVKQNLKCQRGLYTQLTFHTLFLIEKQFNRMHIGLPLTERAINQLCMLMTFYN